MENNNNSSTLSETRIIEEILPLVNDAFDEYLFLNYDNVQKLGIIKSLVRILDN